MIHSASGLDGLHVRRWSLLALCTVNLPAPCFAQSARGTIDGIVTDTGLHPVGSVTVTLVGSGVSVLTGTNGRFRITRLPLGSYAIAVRRVGFAPLFLTQAIHDSVPVRLAVSLEATAVPLDTVHVASKRPAARIGEFEERQRLHDGHFLDASDIRQRNVVYTVDLFRMMHGVKIVGNSILNARMPSTRPCYMQFFVDDVALPIPTQIDRDLPTPNEIAGIEIYVSAGTVPLQYRTLAAGGFCGVVLVWTKD